MVPVAAHKAAYYSGKPQRHHQTGALILNRCFEVLDAIQLQKCMHTGPVYALASAALLRKDDISYNPRGAPRIQPGDHGRAAVQWLTAARFLR
jgi:hypothetical protein